MPKVIVKNESRIVMNDVNYYGGNVLDVTEAQLKIIKDDVKVISSGKKIKIQTKKEDN
jgi:hypothetical protein